MEEIVTIVEVYNLVQNVKELIETDTEVIPPELVTVLETFTDNEQGNNDCEQLLIEIRDSLQYDPILNDNQTSALSEISQRLEVVDTRLDLEFQALNTGIGVVASVLLAYVSFKFMSWITRFLYV